MCSLEKVLSLVMQFRFNVIDAFVGFRWYYIRYYRILYSILLLISVNLTYYILPIGVVINLLVVIAVVVYSKKLRTIGGYA